MLNEEADSSDFSEDEEYSSIPHVRQIRFSDQPNPTPITPSRNSKHKHVSLREPSRRESSPAPRRLAEIQKAATSGAGAEHLPTLTRPVSTRSLKSASGRPRSSSHKPRRPRSQHMRSLSIGPESAGMLRRRSSGDRNAEQMSGALSGDTIVDPELHHFLSDEESSDEEHSTIASTMASEMHDSSNPRLQSFFNAIRRARPHPSPMSLLDGLTGRDPDVASVSSRPVHGHRKTLARSLSVRSVTNFGSGRFGRSDNLFKSSDNLYAMIGRLDTSRNDDPPVPVIANESDIGPPGSATFAAAELDHASSIHLKRLLRQFLEDTRAGNHSKWERALIPVLLQCAENVDPNIQRGDRIDIRTYVKVKKVPGGTYRDTTLVDGLVFSNSIALRDMSRLLKRPRVLLISFPLIYARHQQHFMSLEGVIAQEEEYLKNLSSRIVKLRPDLLLVQGEVAGIARKLLHLAGITVVHDVKASVIQAAARFTQTKVVSSVDKLTMNLDQLGTCGMFQLRTFVHGGNKRSYIFLSGCPRDLGCTIVLRGAETKILKKLKWIAEFLCYVAYNLKLETCLMRDQGVSMPSATESQKLHIGSMGPIPADLGGLETYDDIIHYLKQRILSASPLVIFPEPYLLKRGHEQELQMSRLQTLQRQDPESPVDPIKEVEQQQEPPPRFELIRPEMVYSGASNTSKQVREVLRAIHAAEYERAKHSYASTKRRWDSYLSDVIEPFSPFAHQKIVVQHSIVSNATSDACSGPELVGFEYYQEHDIEEGWERDMPLGEYIERLCGQVDSGCSAGRCDSPMLDHYRQYVHGNGQVTLHVQKYPARFKGMENTILMWSTCKLCGSETQVVPMSAEAWKYSFGKYLELCFWNTAVSPRSGSCTHDIQRDHERYFGFRRLAVRVCYSSIKLVEVIVPRSTITWIVSKDLTQKNELYQRFEERIGRYMSSVKLRLKSIKLDSIIAEKLDKGRSEVEALIKRADGEYDYLMRELQDTYLSSRYWEIIPLNRALRSLQEKVAEWDTSFAEFESNYFPSGRDLRRLAADQFRKTFMEKDGPSPSTIDDDKDATVSTNSGTTLNEKELVEAGNTNRQSEVTVDRSDEGDMIISPTQRTLHSQVADSTPHMASIQSLDLATNRDGERRSSLKATGETSETLVGTGDSNLIRQSVEPAAVPGLETSTHVEEMLVAASGNASAVESQPARATTDHTSPQRFLPTASPMQRSQTLPAIPQLQHTEDQDPVSDPKSSVGTKSTSENTTIAVHSRNVAQQRNMDRSSTPTIKLANVGMQSLIPRAVGSNQRDSPRVSALARHFEQMSREFEKERLRERRQRLARTRQSRAFPTASANPILEIFRDAQEAVRDRDISHHEAIPEDSVALPQEQEAQDHSYEQSIEERPWLRRQTDNESIDPSVEMDASEDNTLLMSYPTSETEGMMSDTDIATIAESHDVRLEDRQQFPELLPDVAKQDTTILNKILSSLWSERSASGWTQLDYPLTPNDHLFADSDLMVREDEPSSLIAFALSSRDYVRKMQKFRERAKAAERERSANTPEAELPEDDGVENVLLGKTATHMSFRFDNGPARLQCRVFYAESFDAIRRKCGVADRFVESLSRSFKLDSKGGKSKSVFLQTHDKRFILKSLSAIEVQAFLKFAPDYFDFMSKCLFHGLPSSLAKMLGLYQVVIKNPRTGTEFNWFMQVMENVFYEGEPTQKFDLKGSMRNRKAEVTGQPDEVLLDENFLDLISHDPLHVRYHSSAILNNSITNDTLFCSKQNVMDYSLIIGLYEDRDEVVVGIIDYIRTYTWDKKLETWIKDRGSRKATIRSPKEYRSRFRRSILTYFPHAPSTWQVFGTQRIDNGRAQFEDEEEEEKAGSIDVARVAMPDRAEGASLHESA